MSNLSTALKMDVYSTGEKVQRPWGDYEVIAVGTQSNGEEYCEKHITVNPGQILSLQSHEMRHEIWTVIQGTLEVVVNGIHHSLEKGKSITIPLHAIHCMANKASNAPCIVHERQVGICREEDIVRYIDAYNRQTQKVTASTANSIEVYKQLRENIRNK